MCAWVAIVETGEAVTGTVINPRVLRDTPLQESSDDVRAELSDARRSILHRQERDALAVLAGRQTDGRSTLAGQTQENLVLRADLLELSALKQSRDLSTLRETMRHQASVIDRLTGLLAGGAGGRSDDPRHVDSLHARLESLEQWVLTSGSRSPQ